MKLKIDMGLVTLIHVFMPLGRGQGGWREAGEMKREEQQFSQQLDCSIILQQAASQQQGIAPGERRDVALQEEEATLTRVNLLTGMASMISPHLS